MSKYIYSRVEKTDDFPWTDARLSKRNSDLTDHRGRYAIRVLPQLVLKYKFNEYDVLRYEIIFPDEELVIESEAYEMFFFGRFMFYNGIPEILLESDPKHFFTLGAGIPVKYRVREIFRKNGAREISDEEFRAEFYERHRIRL